MRSTKVFTVEVEVWYDEDDEHFVAEHNGQWAAGESEHGAVAALLAHLGSWDDLSHHRIISGQQQPWLDIEQTGAFIDSKKE